jgi:hypothetical protein
MGPTTLWSLVARVGGGSGGGSVSSSMTQAWRKFVVTRVGACGHGVKFASRDSLCSTRDTTSIRSITSKSLPPPIAASSPQTLHQSIQDGLLKGSAATNASSGVSTGNTAATAASKTSLVDQERLERNRRYQQAAINAVCSFMVVLLAAQSLKSGSDKRKAELQLEAALEVVSETRDKLKLVLDTSTSHRIAQACLDQMTDTNAPTSPPKSSAWFWSSRPPATSAATNLETSNDVDRLAAIVQQQLYAVIGNAALTEAERDQRRMQQLALAEAAAAQLATPDLDTDTNRILQQALSSSVAPDQSSTAVESNGAVDATGKGASVVKKRVFSM